VTVAVVRRERKRVISIRVAERERVVLYQIVLVRLDLIIFILIKINFIFSNLS
jgi:hypothetical protein